MIRHVILIILITAVLFVCMFRPYMAGEYDAFATEISSIVQFGSLAGLLLVPIALIVLLIDFIFWKGKVPARHATTFRRANLIVSGIITAAAALGAFAMQSMTVAYAILASGVFVMTRYWTRIERLRTQGDKGLGPAPYYLLCIPLVICVVRFVALGRAKEYSTALVIQNSAQLIHDIESYKLSHGQYPISIQSAIDDYSPMMSGVRRYQYERHGQGYNVYFEQFSDRIGTQEIVMYNALGEHAVTVHNQDLLREAPANIVQGYYEAIELPQKHWKVFLFD
jgi:hypothetical protein